VTAIITDRGVFPPAQIMRSLAGAEDHRASDRSPLTSKRRA
jgi:hypothetical protein